MSSYDYNSKTVHSYLQGLYRDGLQRSRYLSDDEVETLLHSIGLFKFKGYLYAFRPMLNDHSIDDILLVFFFDKYLSRLLMDLTSGVETRLKSVLVELCYKQIKNFASDHPQKNNPFFYLIATNYKNTNPVIKGSTLQNWKNSTTIVRDESYIHYGLYYKDQYDFASNRRAYLNGQSLIHIYEDINYPPFHYLVESATLGTIIYLIKNLRIEGFDLLQKVAREFGITNRRVDFRPYLERLNEVRNRAAHRERLFNRSYRSVSRVGHFHTLSTGMSDHKFMDVYLFLFFMLDQISGYADTSVFVNDEIERLFKDFRDDHYILKASKGLTDQMRTDEFDSSKRWVLRGMQ